jgi:hypothetical protein
VDLISRILPAKETRALAEPCSDPHSTATGRRQPANATCDHRATNLDELVESLSYAFALYTQYVRVYLCVYPFISYRTYVPVRYLPRDLRGLASSRSVPASPSLRGSSAWAGFYFHAHEVLLRIGRTERSQHSLASKLEYLSPTIRVSRQVTNCSVR